MSNVRLSREDEAKASEIRASATEREWERIDAEQVADFSLSRAPYELPAAARELQERKKFVFRWIEDSLFRLKEVMRLEVPMRWWPCNSTSTPFLKRECSASLDGAVHCKDQILVFKPYWMHQKYLEIVQGLSEPKMVGLDAKKGLKTREASWYPGEESKIQASDVVMAEAEE